MRSSFFFLYFLYSGVVRAIQTFRYRYRCMMGEVVHGFKTIKTQSHQSSYQFIKYKVNGEHFSGEYIKFELIFSYIKMFLNKFR